MIKFKNNQNNSEYLIIDIKVDGGILLASDILPIFPLLELEKMYLDIFVFEKKLDIKASEISFRKDSILGKWLLENYDQERIIYDNLYISIEKIEQSILIAIIENNRIVSRIIQLFNDKAVGYKNELLESYEEEVLEYILEHDNYENWLGYNSKENKQSIVFENGLYSTKFKNKIKDKSYFSKE